jgi:hypothetical protein
MHRKLREFFDTKGRRLAELKVMGGQEFMILGTTDKLTASELAEFKVLSLQMDTIIWALEPSDSTKREKYIEEIKKYFSNIEEPYFVAREITGGRRLPRGKA